MSFLPYRTGAIFFPLKNHNNFAAEAAFLCRIVTVVTRFLHSLALARKERSDGIAIVRCKRNLPFPFGSLGRVALRSRASMTLRAGGYRPGVSTFLQKSRQRP